MTTRPRIVVLRGHHANIGELRPWELLRDRYEIEVVDHGPGGPATRGPRCPVDDGADEEGTAPPRPTRDPGDASDRRCVPRHGVACAWGRDRPHGRARPVVRRSARPPAPGTIGSGWSRRCGRRSRFARRSALRGRRRTAGPCSPRRISFCRRRSAPAGACCSRVLTPSGSRWSSRGSTSSGSPSGSAPAGGEHLIVSPGRLVWEKGHYDVIRALATSGGAARLLIVGAGPERSRLLRYAADLGPRPTASRSGPFPYDEMPSVFARASCVVLASLPTATWEEQFGLVLAEALAAGAPVDRELLGRDPRGSRRLRRSALHAGRLARARPPARGRPARSAPRASESHIRSRSSSGTRPAPPPKGSRRASRPRSGGLSSSGRGGRRSRGASRRRGEEIAVVGLGSVRSGDDDDVKRQAPSRPRAADSPARSSSSRRDPCRRRGDGACDSTTDSRVRCSNACAGKRSGTRSQVA